MAFWSSLSLVRSASPPEINPRDISAFVRKLADIGALVSQGIFSCDMKFGESIDADTRTTDSLSWNESGLIATVGMYPWDFSKQCRTPRELIESIETNDSRIYRAHLTLGGLTTEITKNLTREPNEKNNTPLIMTDLSFSIGPIVTNSLNEEDQTMVGWMALSFSGYGYFYPWSFREARMRAENILLVKEIIKICRSHWPVDSQPVPKELISGRKALGNLWLYDDLALPRDWLWYVSES